jgi:alcohol dehydrogenase class IV
MAFDFSTARRIVFGPGSFAQLPNLSVAHGRCALILTGKNPLRHSQGLGEWAAEFPRYAIAGEPDFALVRHVLDLARSTHCDSVIAIGGGSVLDAGKAVAMLLANGGDPLDYAEVIGLAKPVLRPSLPMIAVPTTAGAGSEVTKNAVLRCRERSVKVSLRSPQMLPAVALVDPDLTISMPPEVTAATGLDALSQVVEPFVSVRATELTDTLCRDGMRRIARSLEAAFRCGGDRVAREDMALGALYGGMALANAGLGAVHGFAAAIGGMFDAPHGAVCAALLAPVMEANLRGASPALRERYAEVARLLTGRNGAAPEESVLWVRELTSRLGIGGLGSLGLQAGQMPEVCRRAANASSMRGNPVALDQEALERILGSAL